jgi:hypothetical protein
MNNIDFLQEHYADQIDALNIHDLLDKNENINYLITL